MAAAMRAPGLLAKPEDLQIGQEKELRFRSGPAAVEVRRPDLECPGCKRQRYGRGIPPPVPAGKDVLLFEQLREAVDLVGGDGDAPAVCQALPYVVQHISQAARKTGSVDKRHRFNRQQVAVRRRAKRQDTTSVQRLANTRPGRDRAAKPAGNSPLATKASRSSCACRSSCDATSSTADGSSTITRLSAMR